MAGRMSGKISLMAGLAILMLALPGAQAQSAVYEGRAHVVDGDTIEIGALRIRLHAIDAPESRQTCRDAQGAQYACGRQSTAYLRNLIGSRSVRCTDLGPSSNNRRRGRCFAGNVDLQAAMASAGHAIAFLRHGPDYVAQERAARTARRGIWQGQFTRPGQVRSCRNKGGGTIASCS